MILPGQHRFIMVTTDYPPDNVTIRHCHFVDSRPMNAMDIISPIVEILLMILICTGNGMIFVVFWRRPDFHLRSLAHYFILQLAIADFTVGLSMPFHIIIYFQRHILYNSKVCVLRYATLMLSGSASITALLAMSYDRYLAIVRPLAHYSSSLTWRKGLITAMFIWIPPLGLAFILPMLWHNSWPTECPQDCDLVLVLKKEYFIYIMFPVIPVVAGCMVFLYTRVLITARRHVRRLSVQDAKTSTRRARDNQRRRDMNLFKTCLIMIVVFCVCWLPYCITTVLQVFSNMLNNHVIQHIRVVAVFIAVLNSALNPVIYAFRLRGFSKEMKHMLSNKACKVQTLSMTDSSGMENRIEYDENRL